MNHVIYSAQRSGFRPDCAYRHPAFFQSAMGKPDEVTVVGHYPRIVAAYQALGVKVTVVSSMAANEVPPVPEGLFQAAGSPSLTNDTSTEAEDPARLLDTNNQDGQTGDKPALVTQEVTVEVPLHKRQRKDLVAMAKAAGHAQASFWSLPKLLKVLQGGAP